MKSQSISLVEQIGEFRSILAYRWRTVVITGVLVSAALCIGVRFIPNSYQASTTILAYPRKVPEKYVASTVVDDPSDRLALLQQEILSSTRLLEVIHKYGLYPKLIERQGREVALREMRRQIKIQTTRGGSNGPSAFTLSFTGDSPRTVALVANELANSFVLKNLSNREQQVQGTTTFIADQLDEAHSDLQRQENQLRIFRMGHLGEMPDQVNANLQAIGQLQVQFQAISDKLTQLDEQKLLIENAPEADPTLRGVSTPSATSLLQTQISQEKAHLASLLTHVTLQHPDVIASQEKIKQLQRQLDQMPKDSAAPVMTRGLDARLQVIDRERQHLTSEQNAIRARLNSYQSKVDAVPLRQEQLSELTRDYDTARDHYKSLLEKYYSAQMASELEEKQDAERFEVLDPAVPPERPASPDRTILWAGSVVGGFVVGLLFAFVLERLDGTIKSEIDLIKILPSDLEFVGMVSNINPAPLTQRYRVLQAI